MNVAYPFQPPCVNIEHECVCVSFPTSSIANTNCTTKERGEDVCYGVYEAWIILQYGFKHIFVAVLCNS